jgi:proteasome lid subunit RPN8/RPN11
VRHALAWYPEECCGLLLGREDGDCRFVRGLRETQNVAEDSRHKRYLIAPLDLLEAENFVRKQGWEIIGVYHSHPDHAAIPSEFDRAHAILHYAYMILSITRGQAGELSCWTLQDWNSSFAREELRVPD